MVTPELTKEEAELSVAREYEKHGKEHGFLDSKMEEDFAVYNQNILNKFKIANNSYCFEKKYRICKVKFLVQGLTINSAKVFILGKTRIPNSNARKLSLSEIQDIALLLFPHSIQEGKFAYKQEKNYTIIERVIEPAS